MNNIYKSDYLKEQVNFINFECTFSVTFSKYGTEIFLQLLNHWNLFNTQVYKFSQLLGLPVNSIFLVKNYSSEINTNDATDAHILCALKQMIVFGEDYLSHLNDWDMRKWNISFKHQTEYLFSRTFYT